MPSVTSLQLVRLFASKSWHVAVGFPAHGEAGANGQQRAVKQRRELPKEVNTSGLNCHCVDDFELDTKAEGSVPSLCLAGMRPLLL